MIKLPIWIIVEHGSIMGVESLFKVVSYIKGRMYWGHLVCEDSPYFSNDEELGWKLISMYPTGNFGFDENDIIKAEKPTSEQIKRGEELLKKWQGQILVEIL